MIKDLMRDVRMFLALYGVAYFSCYRVFCWATIEGCPIFRTAGGKSPLRDMMDLIRP